MKAFGMLNLLSGYLFNATSEVHIYGDGDIVAVTVENRNGFTQELNIWCGDKYRDPRNRKEAR